MASQPNQVALYRNAQWHKNKCIVVSIDQELLCIVLQPPYSKQPVMDRERTNTYKL